MCSYSYFCKMSIVVEILYEHYPFKQRKEFRNCNPFKYELIIKDKKLDYYIRHYLFIFKILQFAFIEYC